MRSISITDSLSVELLSAQPKDTSGFGKYLQGKLTQLLADKDLTSLLPSRLDAIDAGERGFKLRFAQDVPIGADAVALRVSADSAATLGVYGRPGMSLFEDAFIGPPVQVAAGQAYISLAIHPTLTVGLKSSVGSLAFGFEGGTDAEFRYYRPFETGLATVTLGAACREMLETFAIPNTTEDLKTMLAQPTGTMASASGHGRLQIGCTVDVAAAFNPLASVDTVAPLGSLSVARKASARVGVQANVSGDFQIRVQTMGKGKVRLSYHKVAARELDCSLEATAGPGVTLGDKDLLNMIFSGPGRTSGTTEGDLTAAGISQSQLKNITAAMRAGISRRLSLELSAAFSSLEQNEAAFCYEIDFEHLDAAGAAAVDEALAGNLRSLNGLEPDLPAHGIRVLQSRTEKLQQKEVKWRLNLIGLVNILSLTELARTGTVFHDEESGELIVTDKVTSDRLGATTKGRALRKMLFESVMLTATYKAGGIDPNTSLRAAQTFFTMDRSANRQRMSDYLDAVAALGLMPAANVDERLGAVDDFGRSSLMLNADFDQCACERLFMEGNQARDEDFYEEIGKLALLALVQKRDVDAYRRIPLEDPALWRRMKAASQFTLKALLPPPITSGDSVRETVRVEVVASDYTLIVWWATAMATASRALADMRAYLAGPPAVAPDEANPEFRKRRDAVSRAMVKAVQKNRTTFGHDPWGLVAMFYASKRSAAVSGVVVSPRLTMSLPD